MLISGRITPSQPPKVALIRGGIALGPKVPGDQLTKRLQRELKRTYRRLDARQVLALPLHSERWAVGFCLARAPWIYEQPVQLFSELPDSARSYEFDVQRSPFLFDESDDTGLNFDAAMSSLQGCGIVWQPCTALGKALFPDDLPDDEWDRTSAESLLVGDGTLIYGCLLPRQGDTYERGRVRTVRRRVDDEIVRIVGIEVGRATADAPLRLGSAVYSDWMDEAKAEVVALLERSLAFWLVPAEE